MTASEECSIRVATRRLPLVSREASCLTRSLAWRDVCWPTPTPTPCDPTAETTCTLIQEVAAAERKTPAASSSRCSSVLKAGRCSWIVVSWLLTALAYSESPRAAWLLDAASGEELSNIIYAGRVCAVTFHPGSACVLLDEAKDGQCMRIMDIKTGWECCRLPPHAEGWFSLRSFQIGSIRTGRDPERASLAAGCNSEARYLDVLCAVLIRFRSEPQLSQGAPPEGV